MQSVDLGAVLSPFIVARVNEMPRDPELVLDQKYWIGTWMKENDLLIVECPETADERRETMELLKSFPCVERVSLWAGGETGRVETVGEILHWGGDLVEFCLDHHCLISLLTESEELVEEIES